MALLLSLGELVNNLRLEAGHSSNPATGTNQRDQLVYILNRTQDELVTDWDWPHLTVDRDIPLVTGTRYYSYPADLPFEAIKHVWLLAQSWLGGLTYGIGPQQFLLWNSEMGFTSWPVRRWMHNADTNLIELWPVPSQAPPATPSSQSARIRLRGTRAVTWMHADSDTCAVPAPLLTLFAAAELLAREGAKDAEMRLGKAREALRRYRLRQTSDKTRPFVIGGGTTGVAARPGLDYIPVGYGAGPGTGAGWGGHDDSHLQGPPDDAPLTLP